MALKETIQVVALSDPGQVRDRNEDSTVALPEHGFVALADGMGSYNAGDVASATVTAALSEGLTKDWPAALGDAPRAQAADILRAHFGHQIKLANAAVHARSISDPECEGMCSTLVACVFYKDLLVAGHIGDSRLYRLRNDALTQLTRDHSLLQEQIDSGMIRKEEAHLSNNRNVVTRAVGIDADVEAEMHCHDVQIGDLYLLCSDGLHGMLSDEDIELTLSSLKANLSLTAQQLVEAANDAGGTDNISLVLVRVVST